MAATMAEFLQMTSAAQRFFDAFHLVFAAEKKEHFETVTVAATRFFLGWAAHLCGEHIERLGEAVERLLIAALAQEIRSNTPPQKAGERASCAARRLIALVPEVAEPPLESPIDRARMI